MKKRLLLVAILLGVVLCFVSGVGYGEVMHMWDETKATLMEFVLVEARVDYIMRNPDVFLNVHFYYDSTGWFGEGIPGNVDTKGKIFVEVIDNKRGGFSYESGTALLDLFKGILELLYTFIEFKAVVTDMNTDIVATFTSTGGIPLGYFYQGEYHLWEE